MRCADIRLVVGTRPEAIKLAPLAGALSAIGLGPSLVWTGQHEDLDPGDHGLADLPLIRLGCAGTADPERHARAVEAALAPHLTPPPDLLVVQGDTSSALGAARAAVAAEVALAHVEAGLRTHDPHLPWPEEGFRTEIDSRADLLFAPTVGAAANLAAERVAGEVHVTGNTSIDAALAVEMSLPPPALRDGKIVRVLVTCHRRESWGKGISAIAEAVRGLAGEAEVSVLLHPNRHVSAQIRTLLAGLDHVELVEPLGHCELLARLRDADLVMSDSGGIQEEAPALGVPLLVLRDKTERPEGIACGSARLVGTSAGTVLAEARRLIGDPLARAAMSCRSFPYGDGQAAPRIAAAIADWLAGRAGAAAGPAARPNLRY